MALPKRNIGDIFYSDIMENPKKEPTLLRNDHNYQLCLNCGFPNRLTDKHCQYCNTSIEQDAGLFSWLRQTYYVLRWRWQLKQKRDNLNKTPQSSLMKAVGYFLIGVVLSGAGIYIFTLSIAQSSFTNGLIALLFLCYGVFTLKSLFIK